MFSLFLLKIRMILFDGYTKTLKGRKRRNVKWENGERQKTYLSIRAGPGRTVHTSLLWATHPGSPSCCCIWVPSTLSPCCWRFISVCHCWRTPHVYPSSIHSGWSYGSYLGKKCLVLYNVHYNSAGVGRNHIGVRSGQILLLTGFTGTVWVCRLHWFSL